MDNKEYNQYKMNLIFENWRKYLIKEQVGLPGETAITGDLFNKPEQQNKAIEDYERRKEAEQEKNKAEHNKVLEDQFKVSYSELKNHYRTFRSWAYQNYNRPVVPGELIKTDPLILKFARILTSSVNEENLKKLMSSEDQFRFEKWVLDKAQEVAGLNASSRDAIIGANPFVGRWTEYGRDLEKVIWDKIEIHIPILDPTLDRAELHQMWENSKFKIFGVLLQFGAEVFLDLENLCMLVLTLIASIVGGPAGAAAAGSVIGAERGIKLAKKFKRLHDLLTFQGKTKKFALNKSLGNTRREYGLRLKAIKREFGLFDEVYLAVEKAGRKLAEKIRNLFSSETPVPTPTPTPAPRLDLTRPARRSGGFTDRLVIGKIYKFLQGNEFLVTTIIGILSEFFEASEKEFQKIKM